MPHKLDTDTHVYFYEQEFYVLSNFSAFRVGWEGLDFDTSEHAYQWAKFHETAPGIQGHIFHARSAHDAFKLVELHAHLVRPDWDSVKVEVMRAILWCKLQQHEYVRRKLLQTGERVLVEDSWRDAYWGAGADWDGLNMLGKLWMEIRQELRDRKEPQADA